MKDRMPEPNAFPLPPGHLNEPSGAPLRSRQFGDVVWEQELGRAWWVASHSEQGKRRTNLWKVSSWLQSRLG